MQKRDSNQYNVPHNKPEGSVSNPKLPGEEDENIIKGAHQQDQLDKLKPSEEEDKAANKIGSPPLKEERND
jgi:hypothetical protein